MKDWKRYILIAGILTLASELYWNAFVPGFRISTAVILLPILLMTLGKNLSTFWTCTITGLTIVIFRSVWGGSGIAEVPNIILLLLPNAIFYISYGIIFSLLRSISVTKSFSALCTAEMRGHLSNISPAARAACSASFAFSCKFMVFNSK